MIKVFSGDDYDAALSAWRAIEADLQLESQSLTPAALEELLNSRSMFGGVTVIKVRDVFATQELAQFVLERLEALADSPNMFCFFEAKLPAPAKKELERLNALELFEKSETEREKEKWQEKREAAKIFSVTDALARRDRRGLWIEYWRAMLNGLDPEDVFWKLQWQVKNMLLAAGSKDAAEAALHPFVFGKARAGAANFKHIELISYSSKLLDLWANAHAGDYGQDLDLALEQFILGV